MEEREVLLVALNNITVCQNATAIRSSNVVQYSPKAKNLDLNRHRLNRAPRLISFLIVGIADMLLKFIEHFFFAF